VTSSPFSPRFPSLKRLSAHSVQSKSKHNSFQFSPEHIASVSATTIHHHYDYASPSLNAKQKLSLKQCCLSKTLSTGGNAEQQNQDGATSIDAFQTRPLPPLPESLPVSPQYYILQEEEEEEEHDSPFKTHNLLDNSLDTNRRALLNRAHNNAKLLNFEELERRLKKNSSQPELYMIDFTSTRKNTLSEFRKHKSAYKTRTKEMRGATRAACGIIRRRSNSMDDRLSEASLKRRRKHVRRSRSLDNLDTFTVNELYTDNKIYEEVSDDLKRAVDHQQKLPETTIYDRPWSSFSMRGMLSPRDGGMTVSTNTIYASVVKGENTYARITDIPEVVHRLNIQKRPMPPTPTLLDLCFLKQNPTVQANECGHRGRGGGHLSGHSPSFRSNVSGSSGAYAKIPDVVLDTTRHVSSSRFSWGRR